MAGAACAANARGPVIVAPWRPNTMNTLIAVVLAYLLGSVSFAVVVSKLFGLADPRTYGSKNPGATNVLRSGKKAAAVLTLLLDALKGWVAVWLAIEVGPRYGIGDGGVALVLLAVFLGHLWPVFFRFQGGKGVATAAGIVFAIDPWLGLATLVTWVVVAVVTRYSSLAALVATGLAPLYYMALFRIDALAGAVLLMAGLIIYRHKANIAKLIAGKESRIGQKSGKTA